MPLSPPLRFVLCGGFTTALNIVSRYALSFWLPYWLAIVIAYTFGMLVGFFLFKKVVYDAGGSGKTKQEMARYVVVNFTSLAITLVVSLALNDYAFPAIGFAFRPADIAHVIGVFFGALSNYFGHKHVTFRAGRGT